MKLHSIRWRLPLSYAGIALLAALALGIVLIATLRGYYNDLERRYLLGNAAQISGTVAQMLEAGVPEEMIQDQVYNWSFFLQARVQLLDVQGGALADSGVRDVQRVVAFSKPVNGDVVIQSPPPKDAGAEGNVAFAIVRQSGAARQGGDQVIYIQTIAAGEAVSLTDTFTSSVMIADEPVGVVMPLASSLYGFDLSLEEAQPLRRSKQVVEQSIYAADGSQLGAIRLSEGPGYGDEIIGSVERGWLGASAVAVALAALAGWLFSRRLTAPLLDLTEATARMAAGELAARTQVAVNGDEHGDEFSTLGESFNEMAERVEEIVHTLRNFVSDAAHELHTPLTALHTNLELARDESEGAESNATQRTHYLVAAQEQAARLEAVVDGLLNLSRLEANTATHQPFDLSEVISRLAEVYASRAEQAGQRFIFQRPPDAVVVSGDRDQLERAVRNLLDNALKFTPADGEITLRLEQQAGSVILVVSDTGIGIPAEDLPELFQRFHRGRNAAAYPGSGLGLAIVKAIVEAHDGTISAASSGQGAQFSLQLPCEIRPQSS